MITHGILTKMPEQIKYVLTYTFLFYFANIPLSIQ